MVSGIARCASRDSATLAALVRHLYCLLGGPCRGPADELAGAMVLLVTRHLIAQGRGEMVRRLVEVKGN